MPEFRNARILVFAKAPIPGAAKTRLIPVLGTRRAAALQGALVHHTLNTATQSGLEVELWCHPNHLHPWFSICATEFAIVLRDQEGADLGERMYHAAKTALTTAPVILIGTDCPGLTASELREASKKLAKGYDAVLGPALDGGYYLLGLNRIHSSLFNDISWGSDRVFIQTRQRLRALGWRWWKPSVRRDVDRPTDLAFLPPNLDAVIQGTPFGVYP
uniref:Glycosyltransferase n=1 Tax=Candidatus Kentrum sp. SD TaxID=2126332 RepID=A0A451BK71_9GAMM|nr:MAG: hypothetical protein BECKSD772D_GA0070982_10201 [Candidatus Kentron sp. SD]